MAKIDLYLSKCYSGHMYFNSPYETDDSCGNCDGAKCEYCKTRWRVTDYSEGITVIPEGERIFNTKEEAEEFIASKERDL